MALIIGDENCTIGLSSELYNEIKNIIGFPSGFDDTKFKKTCYAIAKAIINHFKTNAQVTSNVTVYSVTGVQPGAGVSGSGTGTASGTIS